MLFASHKAAQLHGRLHRPVSKLVNRQHIQAASKSDSKIMQLDVWSDYACPYCFLAEGPLQQALESAKVTVRWRDFELRPSPTPTLKPEGEYLQSAWQTGVYPAAKRMGTDIKLPTISPQPYTAKAFEGYHFAAEHGKGAEWTDAVFKAFFQQDRDIGQQEVLSDIAGSIGLDRAAFEQALKDGKYSAAHEADLREAQQLGISSVPTFVATGSRKVAASGMLPKEAILDLITQAS